MKLLDALLLITAALILGALLGIDLMALSLLCSKWTLLYTR